MRQPRGSDLPADLRPLRPNVRPFFFHAYNPAWEAAARVPRQAIRHGVRRQQLVPLAALRRVLEAVEPIRPEVGRIGLVGQGWDGERPGADPWLRATRYYTDPGYLRKMGVEMLPPVRFDQVDRLHGQGVFSPGASTARCSTTCGW